MITIDSIVEEKDLVDAPKVSAKVREYVWEYIYENILTPKNIKLNNTFDYRFTLDLNKFNPELHKFLQIILLIQKIINSTQNFDLTNWAT